MIIETIYKARKITFEDLNRKWMDNVDLSGGEKCWRGHSTNGSGISLKRLVSWSNARRLLHIVNYIENVDDMKRGSIENWLLSTYSVSNLFLELNPSKTGFFWRTYPADVSIWMLSLMRWRRTASFTLPITTIGARTHASITYAVVRKVIPSALVYGRSHMASR